MRRGKMIDCLALGFFLITTVHSVKAAPSQPSSEEIPKIIVSGIEAYKSEGPEAAIRAWIKGSSLEGSKDALSQANVLRQVQDYYGAYKSFDLISSRSLSPTTRIVYFTLNYEKGPLFAKFVVYRSEQSWILVNFVFNTKEELIIPNAQ